MRRFLLSAVLLALPGAAAMQTPPDTHLDVIAVEDGVYVFKPRIDWTHGNGVAILGPDGVVFVDTFIQFNYAEEAIRRLKALTPLPVKYIVNTHWHYDHVMGNAVFKRVFPAAHIVAHEATAVQMEKAVKPRVEGERGFIEGNLAQTEREVRDGKTAGGTPITGSMKAFWDLSLSDAREYLAQYRPERFVNADITLTDALTLHWGSKTLRLIHMAENGHSAGDVVIWIPETRLLIAGDLVVGPTPYATYRNIPGMITALHALIEMSPSTVIPGHGDIAHDLAYVRLLERGFTEYRRAAETARVNHVEEVEAMKTIAFPAIDREFTGDDPMKQWAYRAFFTRNLIHNTYQYPEGR